MLTTILHDKINSWWVLDHSLSARLRVNDTHRSRTRRHNKWNVKQTHWTRATLHKQEYVAHYRRNSNAWWSSKLAPLFTQHDGQEIHALARAHANANARPHDMKPTQSRQQARCIVFKNLQYKHNCTDKSNAHRRGDMETQARRRFPGDSSQNN